MKIAVIGGGAAGLMAAVAAMETDPTAEVHVFERNDALGKKVLISGGGRCNVTTGFTGLREVLSSYPRGGEFLEVAMRNFPPQAVRDWFESRGVPLKSEPDRRVFPKSDDGRDVVAVFERLFLDTGVTVHFRAAVTGIEKVGDAFSVQARGLVGPLAFDRVILTTGGQAYRETGSIGDGYDFAAKFGHTIMPLAPSLSAMHVREPWVAGLAGLSVAKARFTLPGERRQSTAGPFIFTHRGVSGPAAFALSSLLAHEAVSEDEPRLVQIDLLPEEVEAAAVTRLNLACQEAPTRFFENALASLVPKALASLVCRELGIEPDLHAGKVGKKVMRLAVGWIKAVPVHVTGRAAGEEFVTAGGVSLKEIEPDTMQSIFCPGLFFAGEVLDIDGFTGGFNLQSAWATGRLAGQSAAQA
jgi:hypothetical protein